MKDQNWDNCSEFFLKNPIFSKAVKKLLSMEEKSNLRKLPLEKNNIYNI